VEVRKEMVGTEGVLPMVENAAAMSKVRLSATERTDACCGSS
jgi:hypothetical protein